MRKIAITGAFMLMTLWAAAQEKKTVDIKTSAVCGMCKRKIEKDLSFEKGVYSSALNLDTKVLSVEYDPEKTSPEKIRKAVSQTGYDADEVKANPKKYKKLEACCKKDASPHEE